MVLKGNRGVRVLWGNVGGRSLGWRAGHSRSRAACSLLSFGPGTTARAPLHIRLVPFATVSVRVRAREVRGHRPSDLPRNNSLGLLPKQDYQFLLFPFLFFSLREKSK